MTSYSFSKALRIFASHEARFPNEQHAENLNITMFYILYVFSFNSPL